MELKEDTQWVTAGLFLDALTRRDFAALEMCLAPDVRFRALVPHGPFELTSAAEVVERFRTWFGTQERFEVLDAAIGQIGSRAYMRWRLQTTAPGEPRAITVIEQHVFAGGRDYIDSLDLMCSGFQVMDVVRSCVR